MNISDEYEEITTTIGELQPGDLVYGTDGEWHEMELLPVEEKKMYLFRTDAGNVICSYDHEWNLWHEWGCLTLPTAILTTDLYNGMKVGIPDGPEFLGVEPLTDLYCRCLSVDSTDRQFEILSDTGERVFTHNCQSRLACGRLDSTASMMALGNTLATGIDGEHKGAGIISTNAVMANVQIYYADSKWLKDWYKDRGMDEKGYDLNYKEIESSLGENNEEIIIPENIVEYDFEGSHAEVNNKKHQEFIDI